MKKCKSINVFFVPLVLVLLLTFAPVRAFANDTDGHWAKSAIDTCAEYGVIIGYPDGSYRPDNAVTRAEFAAMVNRAFGYGALDVPDSGFSDVAEAAWYADDIAAATALGYMQGYNSDTAAPQDAITREQAAVMLYRILRLDAPDSDSGFSDFAQVSDWARGAVLAMEQSGYMIGYGGNFAPKAFITRSQAAQLLVNVFGTIADGDTDGGEYGNLVIRTAGVAISNATINGDLFITESVGDGDIWLDNVTVEGRLLAAGAGAHTIIVRDLTVAKGVVVDKPGVAGSEPVHFRAIQSNKTTIVYEGKIRDIIISDDIELFIDVDNERTTFNMFAPPGANDVPTLSIGNVVIVENITVNVPAVIEGDGEVEHLDLNSPGVTISPELNLSPEQVTVSEDISFVEKDGVIVGTDKADGSDTDIPQIWFSVTDVILDKDTLTLVAGTTETLTATVLPFFASNKAMTWSSSDEAVATITNGVVTGHAVGTATITVTTVDGGKTATSDITVVPPPPVIDTTGLPDGVYGDAYSCTLEATAASPVTWTVEEGSLPSGLSIVGGAITGAPTETGNFNFTLKAESADGEDFKELSIHVAPALLTFSAENKTARLNTSEPSYTYTVTGWKFTDTDALVTTAPTFHSPTADIALPGDYAITLETGAVVNSASYTVAYSGATLTVIDKEPVSITGVTALDGTYNGSPYDGFSGTPEIAEKPGASFNYYYSGRNTTVYDSATAPTDTGDYTVTITLDDIDYVGIISFDFVIAKANPAVTFPSSVTMTYGETLAQAVLSGESGDGTFAFNAPSTAPSVSESGNYAMTFTPTDTGNYNIVADNVHVNVSKAQRSVVFPTAAPITYGAMLSTSPLTGGSAFGTFEWTVGTTIPAVTNSGYSVTFTPDDADNYDYDKTVDTVMITVYKAEPNMIFPTSATLSYGQTLSQAALAGQSGDGSFTFDASGTAPVVADSGGFYAMTFTPADPENYVAASHMMPVTVNPAPLTVTAANKSVTFGDGSPMYTATISGYVNGETIDVVSGAPGLACAYAQGNNAGNYTIAPTAGTLAADNYVFSAFVPGTLSVGKKTPAIADVNYSTVSTSVYNGATRSVTASAKSGVTGLGSITARYNGSATAPSDAGSYTVTIDIAEGINYTAATGLSAGNFSITQKALTISSATHSKTYDRTTAASGVSVTLSGIVAGDAVSAGTVTAAYTSANAGTTTINIAAVALAGAKAGNYTVTPRNGVTVTAIAKKPLTVTAAGSATLTPIEYTATVTTGVTGVISGDSAPTLTISGANGLTHSGTTLTYDRTSANTNTNPTLTFSVNDSNYSGSATLAITIYDGQASARAIPISSSNWTGFASYANTTDGIKRHYRQTGNINSSGTWTAIGTGTGTDRFSGSYDGGGYTISNLTVSASSSFQGMFGSISGTVKNLGLVNVSVNSSGDYYTGGLVGYNFGTVQNCYVTGSVTGGASYVGGIAGMSSGTVENCYTTCSVNGGGAVGGIVGWNNGATLQNCYTTGNITGNDDVGGIAGYNASDGKIYYCFATGSIYGTSSTIGSAGGLVGDNSLGTTRNCIAMNQNVRCVSNSSGNVGRAIGYNGSTLLYIYGRSGMTLSYNNGSNTRSASSNSAGKDGETAAADKYHSASWWTTTSGNWSAAWNQNIWLIEDGKLPTLKNMPGGTQNPAAP